MPVTCWQWKGLDEATLEAFLNVWLTIRRTEVDRKSLVEYLATPSRTTFLVQIYSNSFSRVGIKENARLLLSKYCRQQSCLDCLSITLVNFYHCLFLELVDMTSLKTHFRSTRTMQEFLKYPTRVVRLSVDLEHD